MKGGIIYKKKTEPEKKMVRIRNSKCRKSIRGSNETIGILDGKMRLQVVVIREALKKILNEDKSLGE